MPDILSNDFSEAGFLRRLRNWRDAMPWLVLADCLAPATSVISVLLSLAALNLGSWLTFSLERLVENHMQHPIPIAAHFPPYVKEVATLRLLPSTMNNLPVPSILGIHHYMTSPTQAIVGDKPAFAVIAVRLLQQFVLLAVWIFPAGYVMRRTVLAVATRERMSTPDTLKLVARRAPSFLSGPALTIGFALVCMTYFLILGWIDRIAYVGSPLATAGGLLGIPVLFVGGVLLLGTLLSFTLMWSSVVAEPYADGFDAASRGFEYIIQRPFRMVAYVVMATLLSIIAINLISGIFWMGMETARIGFGLGSSRGDSLPWGIEAIARQLPTAISFNLLWSFSAAIYLLLRRDANHQDIEDVWEPAQPAALPLPDLNKTVSS